MNFNNTKCYNSIDNIKHYLTNVNTDLNRTYNIIVELSLNDKDQLNYIFEKKHLITYKLYYELIKKYNLTYFEDLTKENILSNYKKLYYAITQHYTQMLNRISFFISNIDYDN